MSKIVSLLVLSGFLVLASCSGNDETSSNNEPIEIENTDALDDIRRAKSDILRTSTFLNQQPVDTAAFYKNDSLFRVIGSLNDGLNTMMISAYGKVSTDSLLKEFEGFAPKVLFDLLSEDELLTEQGKKISERRAQFDLMNGKLRRMVGVNPCDFEGEIPEEICNGEEDGLLVFFSASWCSPCLTLEPKIEKYLGLNSEESMIEIDIQDHPLGNYVHQQVSQSSWPTYFEAVPFWLRNVEVPGVPFLMRINSDGQIVEVYNPEEIEELFSY